MKLKLSTICLATLFALGSAAANAVEFTDAKGDDNGPGNYVYPTDGVYKSGSFDMTRFAATKSGDQVEFAVDVNSSLEDPWGMGVGFAVQMIYVFINTGKGAHLATLPGLNVDFTAGNGWDKVVVLSPQKKGRVLGEANEGFPAETDLLSRKVNEYEGQHRFGGGNDGDCDPHVMDLLEGSGATQKDMLASTCGPTGESVKKATLKMIKK